MTINIDPETRMRRDETAHALTQAGYPTASATLSTMASRGDGPAYDRFGRHAIYRWGTALDWARGRVKPARTASEHRAMEAN